MAIDWSQIENGSEIRSKISMYAAPKIQRIEHKTVSTVGQTRFNLNYLPSEETVKIYINHLCYFEDRHFSVTRNSNGSYIVWTHTINNGGFAIASDDRITVEYWTRSS